MLDTRYVYLHQALGLGPLWLSQHYRVHSVTPPAAKPRPKQQNKAIAARLTDITTDRQTSGIPSRSAVHAHTQTAAASASPTAASQTAVSTTILSPVAPFELNKLPDLLNHCQRCQLHQERTHPLAGQGSQTPQLMVISANPSPEDDQQQQLFSGPAGQLLTNMLSAIGLSQNEVFFTSQVKCSPNITLRTNADIIQACTPYLQQQLQQLQPKAILLLGTTFKRLSPDELSQLLEHRPYVIVPHPARLLRQSQLKAQAWQALQILRQHLTI